MKEKNQLIGIVSIAIFLAVLFWFFRFPSNHGMMGGTWMFGGFMFFGWILVVLLIMLLIVLILFMDDKSQNKKRH